MCPRLIDLRLALGHGQFERRRIDTDQPVTFLHRLVVHHMDRNDPTGHLGRHRHQVGAAGRVGIGNDALVTPWDSTNAPSTAPSTSRARFPRRTAKTYARRPSRKSSVYSPRDTLTRDLLFDRAFQEFPIPDVRAARWPMRRSAARRLPPVAPHRAATATCRRQSRLNPRGPWRGGQGDRTAGGRSETQPVERYIGGSRAQAAQHAGEQLEILGFPSISIIGLKSLGKKPTRNMLRVLLGRHSS